MHTGPHIFRHQFSSILVILSNVQKFVFLELQQKNATYHSLHEDTKQDITGEEEL